MPHVSPYEVVMGPGEAWLAPVGTAFPDSEEAPGVSWVKIGTNGNRNYGEDGVTVRRQQTTATFTGLGSLGPIKAIRSTIGLQVEIPLADISPDALALTHNDNTVSEVGGGADPEEEVINGYMDAQVKTWAMLVRGPSPLAPTGYGQFEIKKVFESSDASEIVYRKSGEPAMLNLQFTAMEDPEAETDAARFYQFRAMKTASST